VSTSRLASVVSCFLLAAVQCIGASAAATAPDWVRRAPVVGHANGDSRVTIKAYLGWQNESQLEQLVQEQVTPGSRHFGQFLTSDQFHAAYSPPAKNVAAVQNALTALGFHVQYTPASGLFVQASGTIAQIEQTFGVTENLYSYHHKTLRAVANEPVLPASLAGLVTYIEGLNDTRALMRPANVRRGALIRQAPTGSIPPPPFGFIATFPCSTYWGDHQATLETTPAFPYDSPLPLGICGYTPEQVRSAYGVDRISETGTNVRVAIADLYASPTIVADVNRFAKNHGLPPLTANNFTQLLAPNVNEVPQGDPCASSGWYGEETLDVTAVHAMAPDASILYVGGACDRVDVTDVGVAEEPLYEVIDRRLADIVSNSWGYFGEEDVSSSRLLIDRLQLLQAAAEGITVLVASGDDGDYTDSLSIASGSWPATSSYVTAVGGTSLLLFDSSGDKSEYGWANFYSYFTNPAIDPTNTVVTAQGWSAFFNGGGSGGGPSLVEPEPFYQFSTVPSILATQTVTNTGEVYPLKGRHRVTPDIAMLADPNTGFLDGETYTISSPPLDTGCTQLSSTTEYCELETGGTSAATPLFAGVMALVNERRFSKRQGPIGWVTPALYSLEVGNPGTDSAPIIDVNAPSEPLGSIFYYPGVVGLFATLDSTVDASGSVIENVDTSLRSAPGYDDVTGLGVPNVPKLVSVLGSWGAVP